MPRRPLLFALLFTLPAIAFAQQSSSACSRLTSLSLSDARVTDASIVAAGVFLPAGDPPSPQDAAVYKSLPAFCRIQIASTPTSDSNIRIEVWLPLTRTAWNGKFRGQGNGGFAGSFYYSLMALSVSQGYATADTDTGHTGDSTDASWALHHPEKIADFGYRAVHLMTLRAKDVITAFYGQSPAHSYFASCSDGGREALMEAQRFPADYDGILAGAPAYLWTNLVTAGMKKAKAMLSEPSSYIPPAKVAIVASAVLKACDAKDGLKDGILNDPRACHFDPETLLCKGAKTDACLTRPQVENLRSLYAPTLDNAGNLIYPQTLPGGELGPGGWSTWIYGPKPGQSLGIAFGLHYFSNMVYEDPNWDWKTFELDKAINDAMSKTARDLNASDPDLRPFAARGGKLILYHGWNDPAISPLSTIQYYETVTKIDPTSSSYVRLFLVPGMQHCMNGPGPSSFGQFGWMPGSGPDDAAHNLYRALENWVDHGPAPETVIAEKIEPGANHKPAITMSRPLCAYPKQPHYSGKGNPNKAASFTCQLPH
ncbi:tannase/feruloyl esterase family alpha/beta hydrolase [Silvibacterium dinghuense]|uniref:Tannase/feruloyl esterase family alpha/beta hydrolase n=1 Tax=Silvibacterium dinghuense TaxID=1560006 RepID=A0A4Q1SD32_9BACT|nr:tannase/feruloyl esterase family alpha/beta hydrolase [Silvibacterium dinghuense]RXS94951.1 tannase/feruloyl esterase family alpha/beta hydrolase [Silvibacterium dinghuense]GGH09322.1 putative esterase [Silvibacterium dinghuense]